MLILNAENPSEPERMRADGVRFRKDYLHMILRQYDPKADQKRPKSAMFDHFKKLNMPEAAENLRDDGPCLAIVPYLARECP